MTPTRSRARQHPSSAISACFTAAMLMATAPLAHRRHPDLRRRCLLAKTAADNDNAILIFTADGKFVMQIARSRRARVLPIRRSSASPRDRHRQGRQRIFVADGYGNRRVIVFDATTGAYKRHWGAYGKPPSDDKQSPHDPDGPAPQQFANPVHCVKLANDGLLSAIA